MFMQGPMFRARRSPFAVAFDELLGSVARSGAAGAAQTRAIPVEVTERSGEYVVAADLPGYRKEEIAVEMVGARVTITAEAGGDRPAGDSAKVLYSERVTGKAVRALELGSEIDRERATARYVDGVLTLTLPKKVSEARKLLAVE